MARLLVPGDFRIGDQKIKKLDASSEIAIGAIPISHSRVRSAMAKSGHRDRLIVAWNAFGALDLVVAVTLGIMSRNGSPLQLIHAGVGTTAMTTLPWSSVPSVLVPFFLIAHAVVFA